MRLGLHTAVDLVTPDTRAALVCVKFVPLVTR